MKVLDKGILSNSVCFSFIPTDLAQKLYFYPTWCGHYFCTGEYYMKRNSYPPLLVAFVREGVFHLNYRNESYEAHKGDIFLLDCAEPHHYYAEDGLEFLYMHYDGSNSHEITQYILSQHGPLIRQDSNMYIGNILLNMVELYKNGNTETMFQSSMRIYHIFEYLLNSQAQFEKNDDAIDETVHYIHDNIGKPITLNDLSHIANQSVYYYAHKFKERLGFSPMEYVTNTRMNKAKVLLLHSKKNITEIAYDVGYSSCGSFINTFTQKIGTSPSRYRRAHQTI